MRLQSISTAVREGAKATGGSDWHKYMHPRYQRRIFFPELWSKEELGQLGGYES